MKCELKDYMNPVFVETGTFRGDGIELAKRAGFKRIISIEISETFCKDTKQRFEGDKCISIVQGDSSVVLWSVIKDIKERMTFMLDAHNLLFDKDVPTDRGFEWWPLVKELRVIAKHPRKDHTIIIDDVRFFELHFGTNIAQVKSLLLEINPNYQFYFMDGNFGTMIMENNILIAEVKT